MSGDEAKEPGALLSKLAVPRDCGFLLDPRPRRGVVRALLRLGIPRLLEHKLSVLDVQV